MGLFGKIKNILFEDDEEETEMPVYTKEEVKETQKRVEIHEEAVPVVEEPIKTSDNSHFRNVKRDIDLNFDEKDVLGEIPGAMENIPTRAEQRVEELAPVEEKKSIFPSFDEAEFERLNSRINKNEARMKREVKSVGLPVNNTVPVNTARKANNNFSSTVVDTGKRDTDRYKVNAGTLGNGKKPFTPSPVISPVYGILDKNYTKDDIVDKKCGLKREKVVKPVVEKEEIQLPVEKEETVFEVDIDSVRRKAYGELEDFEKTLADFEIPELKEEVIETATIENIKEEVSIEDQLEEKFEVKDLVDEMVAKEKELDNVVENVIEPKEEIKKVEKEKSKPQMLDELEKTSTLQILDDIEKELNSIKPISNKFDMEDDISDDSLKNNDTLENDLFNLIDSMYEEGEEDER